MTSPVILLVEDADADAEMVARALRGRMPEARLERVRTAEEALAAVREPASVPDLLLLDLNLPDLPGLVLLRSLRAEQAGARLPVVVLTGSRRQSEVDAAYGCGVQGFLYKPLAPAEMVGLIGAVCDYWFGAVRRPTRNLRS